MALAGLVGGVGGGRVAGFSNVKYHTHTQYRRLCMRRRTGFVSGAINHGRSEAAGRWVNNATGQVRRCQLTTE